MRRFLFALGTFGALGALSPEPEVEDCPTSRKAGMRTGRGGWVFSAPDLRTSFPMPAQAMAGLDRLLDALADLQDAGSPTEVVVAVYPTRPLVVPEVLAEPWDAAAALASYRDVVAHVAEHGLRVVDLYDAARETRDEFYFRRDHHLTPAGARVVATTLAGVIRGLPAAARLPAATFVSRPTTVGPRDVDSRGFALQKHCGTQIPPQQFQHWETTRTSPATVGLLDDVAGPEVVFVGTSNLSTQYNLPGFLQEALGTDVLALRVASGGLLGSLQDWLRSPERDTHPPAVLVWEFNPQDFGKDPDGAPDPKDPEIYRELVPSVYGGCADTDAAALGEWVPATSGEHVLLDGLRSPTGPGWRVLVEAEDPALRAFTLELVGRDGGRDTHRFAPSMRTETHGRFFLDVPGPAPLAGVRARLDTPATGRLRARLCPPR